LSMSVLERTAEIGTAMAMGANRYRILRLFLFEGLNLALIGSMLGVVFYFAAAWLISTSAIEMPPPPGMTQAWIVHINVNLKVIVSTLLVAIPSVLVASLYPAWRASHQQIVDALRKAH